MVKKKKSLEEISKEDVYETALILGYDKVVAKNISENKKNFFHIFKNFSSFRPLQGYKAYSYLIKKGYDVNENLI